MKIYFHGNCQAAALARMVQEVIPDGEITAREIHIEAQFEDRAGYLHDLKSADAIIAQPIRADYQGGFERSLEFIRREARSGATIITFPSIHFDGQFPEWSYLRRGGETLPAYLMDYHSLPAFQAARAREDVDAFIARVLSPGFYSSRFIESSLEASLLSLAKRERELRTDIIVSDLLRERCRMRQVMSTINHPRRALLAACVNRILRKLRRDEEVAEEGKECLAFPQIPLLPSVARFLRSDGGPHLISQFRFQRDSPALEDQATFYRGAYAHYRALPQKRLNLAYARNVDARMLLASISSQDKSRLVQEWREMLAWFSLGR